jgi:hypothetical protein
VIFNSSLMLISSMRSQRRIVWRGRSRVDSNLRLENS